MYSKFKRHQTKNIILLSATACALFLIMACSSDDNPTTPIVFQDTAPIKAMVEGNWTVTNYIDHTLVQTDHFTGYTFNFASSGVLTAFNGTDTVTGTWSVTNDQTIDDSSSDFIDLNIAFVAPPDFEDISDDWDFISKSETKLELIDVSGSSDNTDYLTFEKVN